MINTDEQKAAEKAEPAQASQGVDAGNKPEAADIVSRAMEARKGLEIENQRLEKNLAELRMLKSEEILGGSTEAGQKKEKSEETIKKEAAKKFWAGSSIEKAIEKHG